MDIKQPRTGYLHITAANVPVLGKLLDDLKARAGIESVYRETPSGMLEPPDDGGPAILFYDIETTPALAWVWSAYKTNAIDIEQPSYLLCFAYQWMGNDNTGYVSVRDNPRYKPGTTDDLHVAERLAWAFDRADITVAHNGDKFDMKKANTYFLRNNLAPPSPYQTIDTLKETKREFGHIKNNLDYLTTTHGLGSKVRHFGAGLWFDCMNGDPTAWARMEEYNRRDVDLLRDWYLKIRPWIGRPGKKAHPNLGHWAKGERVCTNCGSDNLILDGTHRAMVSEWRTFRCLDCGAYSRNRLAVPQKNQKGVRTV